MGVYCEVCEQYQGHVPELHWEDLQTQINKLTFDLAKLRLDVEYPTKPEGDK